MTNGREVPELGKLDDVTLAVRDLIAGSQEMAGRIAQVTGRNATDMQAVGMLIQFGPMGAAELARRLGIRSASATALIDRLERAGHAERVRDTADRRRVVVTETPAAREASLAVWAPIIREIDEACRRLGASERAAVLTLVDRVTAAVERGARRVAAGDDGRSTSHTTGAPTGD